MWALKEKILHVAISYKIVDVKKSDNKNKNKIAGKQQQLQQDNCTRIKFILFKAYIRINNGTVHKVISKNDNCCYRGPPSPRYPLKY